MTDVGELLNMDLPALSELPPLITEQEYEKCKLLRKTVSFALQEDASVEAGGDSVPMDISED
jgi:hypothetical protein